MSNSHKNDAGKILEFFALGSIAEIELAALGGDRINEAFLRRQYLPAIKADQSELPPIFSTETFSDELAKSLCGCSLDHSTPVRVRTRRYDGLNRTLGIPHPVPYARLIDHVGENWRKLAPFLTSDHSKIKPIPASADGRLIVMNYEGRWQRDLDDTKAAQNGRYVVHADVSNFFPSVYSHAIDWALRGIETAKKDQRSSGWEATLDKRVRACHNDETNGVSVGPAVFNLISEIVIQRVDDHLEANGFKDFSRYVDDFTAYFSTLEAAEEFIQQLDRGLADYRLQLNNRKTRIDSLANGFGDSWQNELDNHRPRSRSARSLTQYLQFCERLAREHPDKSVLTYGTKILLKSQGCPRIDKKIKKKKKKKAKYMRDIPVMHELTRICFFHPHLIPYLARELRFCAAVMTSSDEEQLGTKLLEILEEAIRRAETDTCLWLIYCLHDILHTEIPCEVLRNLINLGDDLVALSVASCSPEGRSLFSDYIKDLSTSSDLTLCEHWLARYEAFRVKILKDGDLSKGVELPWFKVAKRSGLRFCTTLN